VKESYFPGWVVLFLMRHRVEKALEDIVVDDGKVDSE